MFFFLLLLTFFNYRALSAYEYDVTFILLLYKYRAVQSFHNKTNALKLYKENADAIVM